MLPSPATIEATITADLDRLDRLTAELGWATHRQQTQRLKAFDLTVPQYMALQALRRNGRSCTMSELAEAAFQVAATVTGIVNRLEARGLVVRRANPDDRRSLRVSLTPAGEALLAQIARHKQDHLQAYLGHLSDAERRALVGALEAYLQIITGELNV